MPKRLGGSSPLVRTLRRATLAFGRELRPNRLSARVAARIIGRGREVYPERSRRKSSRPHPPDHLAQLVEHPAYIREVGGSNPSVVTNLQRALLNI